MATNYLRTEQDVSKIFLGDTKTDNESYVNNSGYDPITLAAGTIMGRIHATGVLIPVVQGANNGSQYPIGIVLETTEVDPGETKQLAIAINGEVAESKLIFWAGNLTLDSVLESLRYRDWLQYAGFVLRSSTEMTSYDN